MIAVQLAEAHDESAFGGKAVQLGAAVRAGLPVPAGFALTADRDHARKLRLGPRTQAHGT